MKRTLKVSLIAIALMGLGGCGLVQYVQDHPIEAAGIVVGGVAGNALGAAGSAAGRALATGAGAAVGGVVGNKIEKK